MVPASLGLGDDDCTCPREVSHQMRCGQVGDPVVEISNEIPFSSWPVERFLATPQTNAGGLLVLLMRDCFGSGG